MCYNPQNAQQGMTPQDPASGTPYTNGAAIRLRNGGNLPPQSLQATSRPSIIPSTPSQPTQTAGTPSMIPGTNLPNLGTVPNNFPPPQQMGPVSMNQGSAPGANFTPGPPPPQSPVVAAATGAQPPIDDMQRSNNLNQALNFVTGELEGSAPTREHNGRISRFGIGSDPDEPIPSTQQQANEFLVQKYVNKHPERAAYLAKLNRPQDQAAYIQGLLLNPAPIDGFTSNYQGQVGGDEWKNALLDHQGQFLNSIHGPHQGWNNRIAAMRNWSPSST